METKTKILVTFAKQWQIEGGNKGTTVNYFMLDNAGKFISANEEERGQRCAKVSMPFDEFMRLPKVPGVYDGTFSMTVGSDMKPVLKLVTVEYISDVDIIAIKNKDGKQ